MSGPDGRGDPDAVGVVQVVPSQTPPDELHTSMALSKLDSEEPGVGDAVAAAFAALLATLPLQALIPIPATRPMRRTPAPRPARCAA
jgi:hypothetical protein